MATAVSSHEVSIPRMRIAQAPDSSLRGTDAERNLLDDLIELVPVLGRSHRVDPHHDGVFSGLLVVVLADPHGPEPEPTVEALGSPIRHPNLQGNGAGAHSNRLLHKLVHDARPDLPPMMLRVYCD